MVPYSRDRVVIEGRKSHRLGKEMPLNVIYYLTKVAKLLQIWAGRLSMIKAGIKVEITSLNPHSLEFTLAQDFGGWQDRLLRDSDATMII
jgi:hypothetical protein